MAIWDGTPQIRLTSSNKDTLYNGNNSGSNLELVYKGMELYIRSAPPTEFLPCLTREGIFCSNL